MLFIFLLPEQKKNETKRKFAVCIFLPTPVLFSAKEKELATAIRYAHRNSLLIFLIEVWSNSFFFLTLQKAPPLHGKKKRPDLNAFVGKGRDNIAPLVGVYASPLERGERVCKNTSTPYIKNKHK